MALSNYQRSDAANRPPAMLFGLRLKPGSHPVTTDAPAQEVPQPGEPSTPVVPDAPVQPVDPDPGTPADPERPATVPSPEEPPTPVVPEPSSPEPSSPEPDPSATAAWSPPRP